MAPCSSVAFVDDADGNGMITRPRTHHVPDACRAAAVDASPDGPPAPNAASAEGDAAV